MIDAILMIIGLAVVLWWLSGVIIFAFFCQVRVMPGTPWWPRILAVVHGGFVLPWLSIVMGRLPSGAMIAASNPTPEDMKKMEEWMEAQCQCKKCRRRRGEIE